MKKFDYIDSLRALAILGVVMVHTCLYGKLNPSGTVANILVSGKNGVQLFFLASAFTLFLSYKNRSANEIFPVRNFFIRRFFRIAPMYYLGIGYFLFQNGLGHNYYLGDETHISAGNIAANFTFLHGLNAHWINSLVPGGWSIGVEMLFYVALPFLFSRIKNINQAFIFFIGSLVLNAFLYKVFFRFPLINDGSLWNEYLFFYFPSQLPVFLLGIMLYFVVIEKESVRNISGKWMLVFSGLALLQFASGIKLILPDHVLFSMAFFILAYGLSVFRFKLIVNPVMNHIGKISFSMYLVHFAVLHWLEHFNLLDLLNNAYLNYAVKLVIVVGLSAAISTLFYNLIEVPFQTLGKNIINRWEKKNSPQLVPVVNKTTADSQL
jgi:peptidoglycan/LPS O-acetylase OafA/YrhL